MTQEPAWDSLPSDLAAVAPFVGPFPHRGFLSSVTDATSDLNDVTNVTVVQDGAVALAVGSGSVRFAGVENLTDYHAPLGESAAQALVQTLADFSGYRFRFDSMPQETLDVVETALEELGVHSAAEQHQSTAVLALPTTFDDWLMSISKKERHEVRRKRRRFIAEFGDYDLVVSGQEAVHDFCAMHRTSVGAKSGFMTDGMQDFFNDLVERADARIHRLVTEGRTLAAAFGFETPDGYFYYNTAYEPDAAMASPGVVLLSAMIENQIDRGATVFDFLKGDERYKYRHGAVARPLFVVEGTLP